MDFLTTIHLYFRGEKAESVAILVASVVLLATGTTLLLAVRQPFAHALGATLAAAAVIGLTVGLTVFLRTDRQVASLATALTQSQADFLAAEQPRMRQVVKSFSYYRAAYSAAAIAAAFLAWFVARPSLQGLAVGLLVFAAFGLVIDHYAERRAVSYAHALDALGKAP